MEYVIPYLRIDELRELSQTCKEYNEMIDYYFGTKKKHTIQGWFSRGDFLWLMCKMKTLTHLTFDNQNLFNNIGFSDLPTTLETLIFKDMASILWNTHTNRIKWDMDTSFQYVFYNMLTDTKKVFPMLKHIELQMSPHVGVICLYNPLVDGYDEYGPKYDYQEDYLETELFSDSIPYNSFYNKNIFPQPPKDKFPALKTFILPEAKEVNPIDIEMLEALPWKYYNQVVSDPIISM